MESDGFTAAELHIPDEILKAFAEDAGRQVRASFARPPTPATPPVHPLGVVPMRTPAPASMAAGSLAHQRLMLVGGIGVWLHWAALVAVWAWLAVQRPSPAWLAVTLLGGVALIPGLAGIDYLRRQVAVARAAEKVAVHARVQQLLEFAPPVASRHAS